MTNEYPPEADLIENLLSLGESLGLPRWFWDDVFKLGTDFELSFCEYYYLDEDDDLVAVFEFPESFDYKPFFKLDKEKKREPDQAREFQTVPSDLENLLTQLLAWQNLEIADDQFHAPPREFLHDLENSIVKKTAMTEWVQSGARIAVKNCDPFSRYWYVCQAFEQLMKCLGPDPNKRLKASYLVGKYISEAQWKDRTNKHMISASKIASIRTKAGAGGGEASRKRRNGNLEILIEEIEHLSGAVGWISEDRVVAQAFAAAEVREPNMPKSKKTLDDYATALRSEEPFKSRYEAVFRKNA